MKKWLDVIKEYLPYNTKTYCEVNKVYNHNTIVRIQEYN